MTQEKLLATVQESGECEFAKVGDANIPLNIFLKKIDFDMREVLAMPQGHGWELIADNYMPRKGAISEYAFLATAPTREALVEVVRKYILPLYENAMANLQAMIAGTNDSLCYWCPPENPESRNVQ